MANFRNKVGKGFGSYGRGHNLSRLPEAVWIKHADFSGGYDSRDASEDQPRNSTPNSLDMEVDRKNRITPVPGTSQLELFEGRQVKQVALHASLDNSAELVFFDPPFIGVKQSGETRWYDVGLHPSRRPFAWANFGSTLIFSNGVGGVYARQPGSTTVEVLDRAPEAASYTSFAGRVFAASGIIEGNWEPLGVRWSAASSDYRDWRGLGSGFELLIDDLTVGDHIVALRPLGLSFLAVCLRKSIWVGRATGLRDRPVDFQPRVTGLGFVNSRSVVTTRFGVIGLSDGGVYLFDGNTARHVSPQIDQDLLPLRVDQLDQYHAAYNPIMLHYYLFTPDYLWVYDIEAERWYRRSLTSDSAVMFAEQASGTTWAELSGTWADQQQPWMDYKPLETDEAQFMLLKRTPEGTVLGLEDAGSFSNWGEPMKPYWDVPYTEGQYANMLLTTQRVGLRYEGSGTINVYLPDNEGVLRQITSEYSLNAYTGQRTRVLHGNHTGLFTGSRLEVLAGRPRISRLEFGVLPRGPRIENTRFEPREYYSEFLG